MPETQERYVSVSELCFCSRLETSQLHVRGGRSCTRQMIFALIARARPSFLLRFFPSRKTVPPDRDLFTAVEMFSLSFSYTVSRKKAPATLVRKKMKLRLMLMCKLLMQRAEAISVKAMIGLVRFLDGRNDQGQGFHGNRHTGTLWHFREVL